MFIDYDQTVRNGLEAYRLNAHGQLPQGMYFTIVIEAGKVSAKSRANGDGSIRYRYERSLDDAMAHGIKWARRKITEARKVAS